MTLLEKLTVVMGILMALASYPQAWRIFQTRSAEDVSLWTFGFLSIGTTIWLLYGVASGHTLIAAGFLLAAIGSWLVFGLTIAYRNDDRDIDDGNVG